MKIYSKDLNNTPQTEPIPGRTDMVQNNAGGYGFKVTDQERLERFLTIGSETGTYYVNEQKLAVENASNIINYVKTDGKTVLGTVINFIEDRRAPKVDPALFVLSLLATYGTPEVKSETYSSISKLCKTGTHLFTFLANIQNLRGWSRGLRTGVANWYTNRTPDSLAYQVIKYRNRAGFTHKDVLALSHPKATSNNQNDLFKYIVGKNDNDSVLDPIIYAYEAAQTAETKVLVSLIKEFGLTWEMVPTEKLNDSTVLGALLQNMPLHALLRNLNRFSYNDMTNGVSETVKTITAKLSKDNVVKSGLHPVTILNALRVYAAGRGDLGSKTWTPNQNIVDALDTAYYSALDGLVPTNKAILVAVDVSGSMSISTVNKSKMTPKDVAAALSMSIIRPEPNAELIWFDTMGYKPTVGRRSSLDEILKKTPHGGGTDCSIPIRYAIASKNKYDAIVILTDSETWAGNSHAVQQLAQYRSINPNVKVVEVGMVATGHSVLPMDDKNVLKIAGFDSTVVDVINGFISGS